MSELKVITLHEVWKRDVPYYTSEDAPEELSLKIGFEQFEPKTGGKLQSFIQRPGEEKTEKLARFFRKEGFSVDIIPYSEENSTRLGWKPWDGYLYGFKHNEEMELIANDLIENDSYHHHLLPAKFAFTFKQGKPATDEHGNYNVAFVQLASKVAKFTDRWDFVMSSYESIWGVLDEEGKRRLIDHELCHCGYKGTPYLIDHNVKEFKHLYEKYKVPFGEDLYSNRNELIALKIEQMVDAEHS